MRSPYLNAPLVRFEDQAVWIHDVLAQLAPDGPHIVGYSFGGATATVYAREYPEDARSLVVLEPVFTFSYPPLRLMSRTMVASIPSHWNAALPTPHLLSKEETERLRMMPIYAAIASDDSPPMQAAESLGEKLNNFWANSE